MSKIILFQGDSITDAGRSREDDHYAGCGYPTLVKADLGFEHPGEYVFYNRGISGNRLPDVYARIVKDILNLKPDYMSLLIGVNDIWHGLDSGNGTGEARFEKLYSMLIEELREELPDLRIMILEPFVLKGIATDNTEQDPNRWEKFQGGVAAMAKLARKTAEKYQLPFVALQDKFEEACEKAPESYWLIDGVHPTAMGHELIKREWLKAFQLL